MSTPLDVELAADGARRRSGQHGRMPIDPFAALREFGVLVLREPADIDGAYMRHGDVGVALINTRPAFVRQRFTAAHELAHHIFYRADSPEALIDVSMDHAADIDEERDADAFAAAFLMPEDDVRRIAREWPNVDEAMLVALSRCQCSKPTVARRFYDMGLATPEQQEAWGRDKRSLAKRLEPLGLKPPPERDAGPRGPDPRLWDAVAAVRKHRLLDHPDALLDLTP